jgi:hypothetical protein
MRPRRHGIVRLLAAAATFAVLAFAASCLDLSCTRKTTGPAASGPAASERTPPSPRRLRAAESLPKDCLAYVEIAGMDRFLARAAASPPGAALADEEVAAFLDGPLAVIAEEAARLEKAAGLPPTSFRRLFRGSAALALLPSGRWAACAEVEDPEAAGRLARVLEKSLTDAACRVADGRLFILPAGMDVPSGADSLAQDADHRETWRLVDGEPDIRIFVSGEMLSRRLLAALPPGREGSTFEMRRAALGLDSVRGAALTAEFNEKGVAERARIALSGAPRGLLRLPRPLPPDGVPPLFMLDALHASAAAMFRIDPEETVKTIDAALAAWFPDVSAARFKMSRMALEQELGFSIERDFLPALTGEILAVRFPGLPEADAERGAALDLLWPDAAVMQIVDPAAFSARLDRLAAFIDAQARTAHGTLTVEKVPGPEHADWYEAVSGGRARLAFGVAGRAFIIARSRSAAIRTASALDRARSPVPDAVREKEMRMNRVIALADVHERAELDSACARLLPAIEFNLLSPPPPAEGYLDGLAQKISGRMAPALIPGPEAFAKNMSFAATIITADDAGFSGSASSTHGRMTWLAAAWIIDEIRGGRQRSAAGGEK